MPKKPSILSTGRTSIQSQIPYAKIVSTIPSLNDPQSQEGSLIILSSGIVANDGIYSFHNNLWTKVASLSTTFGNQAAATVFAGPISGAAAAPTFRLLTSTDLPIVKEANASPISVNANTTSEQDLSFVDFTPGELNRVGKVIELVCFGTFDNDTNPTITFRLKFSPATNILIFVPNTPSTTHTNLPWVLKAYLIVTATGASGNLEVHGEFSSDPSTSNGRISAPQLDLNTAVSSAVDLTAAQRLKITIQFSTGSVSNVGRQRMMLSKIYQ